MKRNKYEKIENYILDSFNKECNVSNNFEKIKESNKIDLEYKRNNNKKIAYSLALSFSIIISLIICIVGILNIKDEKIEDDPSIDRYLIKELNYNSEIKDSDNYYLEILFNYQSYNENLHDLTIDEYYNLNNQYFLNKLNLNVDIDFIIASDSQAVYLYFGEEEYKYYFEECDILDKLKNFNKNEFVYDIILYDIDNDETKIYLKKPFNVTDSMIELVSRVFSEDSEVFLLIEFNYPKYTEDLEVSEKEYYEINNQICFEKLDIVTDNIILGSYSSCVNVKFDSYNEYLDYKYYIKEASEGELVNKVLVNLSDKNINIEEIDNSYNKKIKTGMKLKEVINILGDYDSIYILENNLALKFKKNEKYITIIFSYIDDEFIVSEVKGG